MDRYIYNKQMNGLTDECYFQVKESPVPSDSLLTIDLKSGPRVTLGTHVITLDKFFEGKNLHYIIQSYCNHH